MSQLATVSAPQYRPTPPRGLTDRELTGMLAIADVLIPDNPAGPRPSAAEGFLRSLDSALAARRDAFEAVAALAGELADESPEDLALAVRRRSENADLAFLDLSTVVAGAYLMLPDVRRAIAYPGQAQRPPRFDEAVEQVMDGILDPVIERGAIFRTPPAPTSTQGAH